MAVLVTGACGWIGRRVCSYLSSLGIDIVGTDIGPKVEGEEPWAEYVQIDITEALTEVSISSRVDVVINCAGYAHHPNENSEEQKMFYAVNRDGTQHVLDWCEREGIRRFLYVSSIAFYDWVQSGNAAAAGSIRSIPTASASEGSQPSIVAEDHPVFPLNPLC